VQVLVSNNIQGVARRFGSNIGCSRTRKSALLTEKTALTPL
jgi:hypothetical protein